VIYIWEGTVNKIKDCLSIYIVYRERVKAAEEAPPLKKEQKIPK
jgi:hypothetical protein